MQRYREKAVVKLRVYGHVSVNLKEPERTCKSHSSNGYNCSKCSIFLTFSSPFLGWQCDSFSHPGLKPPIYFCSSCPLTPETTVAKPPTRRSETSLRSRQIALPFLPLTWFRPSSRASEIPTGGFTLSCASFQSRGLSCPLCTLAFRRPQPMSPLCPAFPTPAQQPALWALYCLHPSPHIQSVSICPNPNYPSQII